VAAGNRRLSASQQFSGSDANGRLLIWSLGELTNIQLYARAAVRIGPHFGVSDEWH